MMDAMIQLIHVSKTYDRRPALSDLTFDIEKGEFVYEETKATVDLDKIHRYAQGIPLAPAARRTPETGGKSGNFLGASGDRADLADI